MNIDITSTYIQSGKYRGRFAPSPTGPLHFGSLVTALGSYLQARSLRGEWLLRMEDIDPPRERAGAANDILRVLDAYQLHWDGPVTYQSQRQEYYEAALTQLSQQGDTFPCSCTRRSIRNAVAPSNLIVQPTQNDNSDGNSDNNPSNGQVVYPGTCRAGLPPGTTARAVRLRVPAQGETDGHLGDASTGVFTDGLQGLQSTPLASTVGDFVVRRADGLYAYHLAVVVDDADQHITEVVRGTDLLTSTAPQRYLQKCLGYSHPHYCHLPIATNQSGQKLSKQTFARAIDLQNRGPTLLKALDFLGQEPDPVLTGAAPVEIVAWAIENWVLTKIPKQNALYADI